MMVMGSEAMPRVWWRVEWWDVVQDRWEVTASAWGSEEAALEEARSSPFYAGLSRRVLRVEEREVAEFTAAGLVMESIGPEGGDGE
jgi:hypothetical protein